MSDLPCKTLVSADRKRVVVIFQRPDGHFGYRESIGEADDTSYEQYPDFIRWPKMAESSGIFPTAEAAETDARLTINWLASNENGRE